MDPAGAAQGSTEAAGLAPNDCQGSEAGAAAVDPPQGSVWLAAAAAAGGPQGSLLGGAGAEEGRASIRSSRVVC